jgi:riboflavin kinase/FMN adenylyltransferase
MTMLLLRHLVRVGRRFPVPVLTLGNFDGVHVGHQEILQQLVLRARSLGGSAVVLTFQPHPTAVLAPARAPRLITDWRTRIDLIAAMGVDAIIVQRFTRAFAAISADEFVRRFLVDGLGVRAVVVGHRVSFGHNRSGGAETLRQFGARCGFDVEVIGPVEVSGMLVSSSAVRQAIGEGDFGRGRVLLGRSFSVAGRVIHGHHRGHMLGFPTANLRIAQLVLPPDGVYAVRALVKGVPREGVANLGFNPTFQEHERSLEVHLFDLDENLYGQRIEVRFVRRLRGETKFPSVQALAEQIARDAAAARRVLAESPE